MNYGELLNYGELFPQIVEETMEIVTDIIFFSGGSDVQVSACNAGDLRSILRLRISPREGNGNPLHYSCLENPMDGGP